MLLLFILMYGKTFVETALVYDKNLVDYFNATTFQPVNAWQRRNILPLPVANRLLRFYPN
jgi:hypothetical protein